MASTQPRFFNAPPPKEAPNLPYKNEAGGNPVLTGLPLAVLSRIIASSSWLQQILWKMNKFDELKSLPGIDHYNPRYDPTVIPIAQESDTVFTISTLPQPRGRQNEAGYYTCADYHNLYMSGALTPTEVAEFLIPIITRKGGKTTKYSVAYLETREDLVLAAARASTERYKKGQPLSVLDGVPVAVKDEVDVKGYGKCLGSNLNLKKIDETSWCVRKWEEAGAIMIGKTNMHELGMDTSGNNPITGTPINPHNIEYYPGGSSSGSASTVGQGICPITLGCDGGGSIRLPAAFCGVWGIKPTHNRVSSHPTENSAYSVAVSGPICGSIEDLALAFRIMAQPDPSEENHVLFPNSLSRSAIENAEPKAKIIGIDRTWVDRSDPEVLNLFDEAIAYYESTHGYKIIDISLPLLPENQKAHSLTILCEGMAGLTPDDIRELSHSTQVLFNVVGNHASALHFLAAQRLKDCMMRHLAWLWEQYPGMLILTPTTPCAGWKIKHPAHVNGGYGVTDGDTTLRTMEYTYLANWVGTPAISCPMGYAEGNVPVGIMAMGEWGSEEQLLAFGQEAEGFLGKEGTRRPKGEGDWLDVLKEAKKR